MPTLISLGATGLAGFQPPSPRARAREGVGFFRFFWPRSSVQYVYHMHLHVYNRTQCFEKWHLLCVMHSDISSALWCILFIKRKKASCDPTNGFNDPRFDKQWPRRDGWNFSIRKRSKAYTFFLSWERKYVLGWLQPKAKKEFKKAWGWRPQLWGGACSQTERLPVWLTLIRWMDWVGPGDLCGFGRWILEPRRGTELV